jgi:Flp pilus assembly protein TadD
MARRLEEARLEMTGVKDGRPDQEAVNAAYGGAFAWYGLDVDGRDPEEAAGRVRSSPIRAQLVAALDDWAFRRRRLKADGWERPLAVARAADPDPWRDRLRDALEGKRPLSPEELADPGPGREPAPAAAVLLYELTRGTAAAERAAILLGRVRQRHPDDFWANHNLGMSLYELPAPRLEEAIRYLTAAVAVRPQSPGAHNNLGLALWAKGLLDEAAAELREALRLKPDYAEAHNNLGNVLRAKGLLDEAAAEYREAIRLKPDYAMAHTNLGLTHHDKGHLDEAVAEYREAVRLQPDDATAHYNLGNALKNTGRQDDAAAEYREALHLKPDYAEAYYNLGLTHHDKGHLDEAVAEYREAIRLKPDYAKAHCNLGAVLVRQGHFRQAVEEHRRGHELGSRLPGWPYPSAQWVRQAEELARLDERLPDVLAGKDRPKDAAERLGFAEICQQHARRYAASARFYAEAFDAEPKLAGELDSHRYNAACSAALAGCGKGEDTANLDVAERARLRRQALDWLRAELTAWRGRLDKEKGKARPAAAQALAHWRQDDDLAGVRGEPALAALPEAERGPWRALWADVAALLGRTAPQTPQPGGGDK